MINPILNPKDYKVIKGYFKNNSNYGRTTKLIDKYGNLIIECMGVATKKELLHAYAYSNSFNNI